MRGQKSTLHIYRYLILPLLLTGKVYSQNLHYSVDLLNTRSKSVTVGIEFKKIGVDSLCYQMPLWAPGAYFPVGFGRFVDNFAAYDDNGDKKQVTKVNDNRWIIQNASNVTRIRYEVRTSHTDAIGQYYSLAHIDSNFFFVNGTALFGYLNDTKNTPSTVTYFIPSDWTLHCALETKKSLEYTAQDYDELVDAPILAAPNLYTTSFDHKGTKFEMVLSSDASFPMDSLQLLTKKIVSAHADFWGYLPFNKYLFLIHAPTLSKLPSGHTGALEHSNSSAYLLLNLPWQFIKDSYAHIISHEFFHAWNVKRIHSSKLGPFDYTVPVRTTSLWLSEGITDYYADLLLSRYGITSEESFEKSIARWNKEMRESPYAYKYSLEEFSVNSTIGLQTRVTYFKGSLVGLLLDIEIRTQTQNKHSLDDVMYGLYSQAKRGVHFDDFELLNIMDSISESSLFSIHASYIAGNDTIPINSFLEKMGLNWTSPEDISRSKGVQFLPLDDSIEYAKKYFYVKWIDSSSRYYRAGLRVDDILQSINDTSIYSLFSFYSEPLDHMLENSKPYSMQILRNKEKIVLNIGEEIKKRNSLPPINTISYINNPTPEQLAIRKGIYGKKEGW